MVTDTALLLNGELDSGSPVTTFTVGIRVNPGEPVICLESVHCAPCSDDEGDCEDLLEGDLDVFEVNADMTKYGANLEYKCPVATVFWDEANSKQHQVICCSHS